MTIGAATVWRVRPGGDDANGAGYDATISGAGTDYTQQDAAQLSLTDIACSSTTTVTSATGGFTAAMIGNAIRITGGGATSGYYFITAWTDTNTITVDRTPGAVTNGTGKVGGAAATPWRIDDSANATGDKCVAGNKIYIRGAGSLYPGSADYTKASTYSPVEGDTTNGMTRWIGENGRPRLSMGGNGYFSWNRSHRLYQSLYLTRSAAQADEGVLSGSPTGVGVLGCVIDGGDQNGPCLRLGRANFVLGCDIFGHASAPTSGSLRRGIIGAQYDSFVAYNRIHHCGDDGVEYQAGGMAIMNIIDHCKGNGIQVVNHGGDNWPIILHGNTIDANEGHGIDVASGHAQLIEIVNNILSNHTGSGKYGLNFAGTLATNDRLLQMIDRNAYYNNTGHRNGISAGTNDIDGTDPGYVDAATGDYRIGAALKALGFPIEDFAGVTGARSFMDIGALQREEAGAGGGMLGHPGMSGRLVI